MIQNNEFMATIGWLSAVFGLFCIGLMLAGVTI